MKPGTPSSTAARSAPRHDGGPIGLAACFVLLASPCACVGPPRYPGDVAESRLDRAENRVDRREDRYDRRHYSGPGDFVENRIDRAENKLDRREDRWDRRGAW